MEIARNAYLNKLLAKRGNGLVKIVTGIRRCGKSYLLSQLFKKRLLAEGVAPDHIIEVAEETHLFENVIYNELKIRGYSVDVGVVSRTVQNADGTKA